MGPKEKETKETGAEIEDGAEIEARAERGAIGAESKGTRCNKGLKRRKQQQQGLKKGLHGLKEKLQG